MYLFSLRLFIGLKPVSPLIKHHIIVGEYGLPACNVVEH